MKWVIVWTAALAAGAEMPSGYFRGPMAGWSGTTTKGELRARASSGEVFSCGFDAKSYLELEKQRVTIEKLRDGDPLEVLAYRRPGETSCYVLSLTVAVSLPAPRPARRLDMSPPKTRPAFVRHGSLNIAGVVMRLGPSSLSLHTRDGIKTIQLRRDTRVFANGLRMDLSDVHLNQRLAVEATRNSDGSYEAFQLTWGELSVH